MKFHSLSKQTDQVDFSTALFDGIAPDGGLYMPDKIPGFSPGELDELKDLDFNSVASRVIKKWLGENIPEKDLIRICQESFNFPISLVRVGYFNILELFHGPTMAFKDVAARFLAHSMSYFAGKQSGQCNILVATSGDTGGAIANAFSGVANTKVFVLFPKNRVSKLQYQQLTQVADNIFPIEVNGSFDDCQALVKKTLTSKQSSQQFTTANSINIGRLLPQTTYYVYSALQNPGYQVVVPTGNLGNATAALLAQKMSAGPSHITLACNSNDTLAKYASSGNYRPQKSKHTLSNAMDVGDPNNFARFNYLLNDSVDEFNKNISVCSITDQETINTIKKVYSEHDYLLDPHTAVGWATAKKIKSAGKSKKPIVVVATASPEKFSQEIKRSCGIDVPKTQSPEIKFAKRSTEISNSFEELTEILISS